MYARYRNADLGEAGAADTLREVGEDPMIYRGGWRKARQFDWRLPVFPGGLGRSVGIPLRLPELTTLPEEYGLESLALFHAGINPASDAIALGARMGLDRWIGKKRLQRWFSGAARCFTFGTNGLGIVVKATGDTSEWLDDPLTASRLRAAGFTLTSG